MFLKYSEMWDMDLGGEPSKNEIPHWFGNAAYVVVGGLCKLLFRYRVDNRDKLRAFQGAEGALVICNHTLVLDVVLPCTWPRARSSGCASWPRQPSSTTPTACSARALSAGGRFPREARHPPTMTSIKRAVRMLKRQELVGILPRARAAARPTGCPPSTPACR